MNESLYKQSVVCGTNLAKKKINIGIVAKQKKIVVSPYFFCLYALSDWAVPTLVPVPSQLVFGPLGTLRFISFHIFYFCPLA